MKVSKRMTDAIAIVGLLILAYLLLVVLSNGNNVIVQPLERIILW